MKEAKEALDLIQRFRDAAARRDWVAATSAAESLYSVMLPVLGELRYYRVRDDKEHVATMGKVNSW